MLQRELFIGLSPPSDLILAAKRLLDKPPSEAAVVAQCPVVVGEDNFSSRPSDAAIQFTLTR